jgi:hypothetical protein
VQRRILRIDMDRGTRWIELTHDLLTAVIREHRDRRRVIAQEMRRRDRERPEVERLAAARAHRDRRRLTWLVLAVCAVLVLLGVLFLARRSV